MSAKCILPYSIGVIKRVMMMIMIFIIIIKRMCIVYCVNSGHRGPPPRGPIPGREGGARVGEGPCSRLR